MASGLGKHQKEKEIYEKLRSANKKTIVLHGPHGIGKTWMARKLSDRAVREDMFDIAFWVFLNKSYDISVLSESIARELSLLSATEEREDENQNKEEKENLEILGDWEHLKKKISETIEKKRLLLILDDAGSEPRQKDTMSKLRTLLDVNILRSYTVLITQAEVSGPDDVETISEHDDKETRKGYDLNLLEKLSKEESLSLMKEIAGSELIDSPSIKHLTEGLLQKDSYLPSEVILIVKALSYCRQDESWVHVLESALGEAKDNENCNLIQLLRNKYVILLPNTVLVDCCWGGKHFLRDSSSVHFNELIAYWILEGYLGHGDNLERAYEKGYHVLMELVDCQILKILEAGYVTLDQSIINKVDYRRCGLSETAKLGLAIVFEHVQQCLGFGRIAKSDGMMKTLSAGKGQNKLSTSLLDGNHLCNKLSTSLLDGNHRCVKKPDGFLQSEHESQVLSHLCVKKPDGFLQCLHESQVLSVFNPTFKSLPEPLSKMQNLIVLVLRGCSFLENIAHNLELKHLIVLEISGPSPLKKIPDDFFKLTTDLQSLNLSALQIDSLPSSFYNLTQVVWLILRGCSRLKTLGSLKKLAKLMVLDLSGATSLAEIKDLSFSKNPNLQMLNFSQTQIEIFPFVTGLKYVTHLLLSGCTNLGRLRGISSLTGLEVLDLSGAVKFKYFHDQSLEKNVSLKVLNLKGCSVLEELPYIDALAALEVLDLSGTSKLVDIDDDFSKMRSLRVLNLSDTKVKSVSSLSNLSCLCHLLLSHCSCLSELPSLNSLPKLEVLDLSGCKALIKMQISIEQASEIENESSPSFSNLSKLLLRNCNNLTELKLPSLNSLLKLEELDLCGISLEKSGADFLTNMSLLQVLNLSETRLKQLPSMSNLKNLKYLSLRDCSQLEDVTCLHELPKLEVLDLSGTAVKLLPTLDGFSKLRQLLLRDCSRLEEFLKIEILELLRGTITKLPYGISTHLEFLELPNMIQGVPKESSQYKWSVSGFPSEVDMDTQGTYFSVSSAQFLQLLKKKPTPWEVSSRFCLHPVDMQEKAGVISSHRDKLLFRDIYFQTSQFDDFKEKRSLQICGFDHAPEGIRDTLEGADYMTCIDNSFSKGLSDIGSSGLDLLKGCWIQRCNKMETVFHEEVAGDSSIFSKIEILGVSHDIELKSMCDEKAKRETFQNLKSLYIDGCPMLSTVFPSLHMLGNLKVLHIKYCDKLETLFGQNSQLSTLESLHLWELPELKSIGSSLPSLRTLKVWECPKLEKAEEIIQLAKSLQTLWISGVAYLKHIYAGKPEAVSFENLEELKIENCPILENVSTASQLPKKIKTLEIKSCVKLEIVFAGITAGELSVIETLHLQELPKLRSVGVKFPPQATHIVLECPKYKDSFTSSVTQNQTSDT